MLICFKDYKRYIHILNHVLDLALDDTSCLSYTANTMPADALASLGASASAGMVLTPKARIFHLQHQKS